jgi:pyruvate/2-oxoglutarate dehydrogenase complex dihydrolipoamide dehydrogenase (E3) component
LTIARRHRRRRSTVAIPGIEDVGYVTSETMWGLRELPKRLLVLGGGPIGCELAQCFARLGSKVTQVEMLPRILIREDPEISQIVTRRFATEGITVLTGHKAKRFVVENGEKILTAERQGGEVSIPFDLLLCAVGRVANTTGYGLEDLGIGTTPQRTVETNEYLQTLYPNILACGDIGGTYQFTHRFSPSLVRIGQRLVRPVPEIRADYSVIPWATFTDPEVARRFE